MAGDRQALRTDRRAGEEPGLGRGPGGRAVPAASASAAWRSPASPTASTRTPRAASSSPRPTRRWPSSSRPSRTSASPRPTCALVWGAPPETGTPRPALRPPPGRSAPLHHPLSHAAPGPPLVEAPGAVGRRGRAGGDQPRHRPHPPDPRAVRRPGPPGAGRLALRHCRRRRPPGFGRFALHAARLTLAGLTASTPLSLEAPLPDDFRQALEARRAASP